MFSRTPVRGRPGFRFAATDGLILLASAVLCYLCIWRFPEVVWVVIMAVGHFFLFCNVFRVCRNLELLWAGAFVVFVMLGTWREWPWYMMALLQIPVTVAVIGVEVIGSNYRGVGYRFLEDRRVK